MSDYNKNVCNICFGDHMTVDCPVLTKPTIALCDNQPQSVSGGSDTPRTDAIIDAIRATLRPYTEHFTTATAMLMINQYQEIEKLERENQQLQLRAEQAEVRLKLYDGINDELNNVRQERSELQSKLSQAEQVITHDKKLLDEIDKERQEALTSKEQLEQQNAALREALEQWKVETDDGYGCTIFKLSAIAEQALSLPPTTQDWVKKEDVKVIVEKFKEAVSIVEDALDYRPDDEAAGQWAEVKQGLKLAKQLVLEKE